MTLRHASRQTGSSEGNTLLLVGLGATTLGGYVVGSADTSPLPPPSSSSSPPPPPQVYRQLRQQPPTLQSLKKEGYKESLAVHPEQVAESEASQAGPPPTTTEVPLVLPSHVQYLLIGAGTASHSCANAIQQRDASAKARAMERCTHTKFFTSPLPPLMQILMIGEEGYPPYMRPPLSKALWLEEDREQARALRFRAAWTEGKFIE